MTNVNELSTGDEMTNLPMLFVPHCFHAGSGLLYHIHNKYGGKNEKVDEGLVKLCEIESKIIDMSGKLA